MGRTTKRLAKAAVALAATTLIEKAIDKVSAAAKNRRVKRKAAEVGKKVRKFKVAAEKKVPVVRKQAARQLERLAKITAP